MNNKDKYGEVFTPSYLVEQMIDDAKMIMGNDFFLSKRNIFETGCGKGVFYSTLMQHIQSSTPYIMNEINAEHESILHAHIPSCRPHDKVFICDLFDMVCDWNLDEKCQYDLVWGNLPFQSGGKKFVPGLATFHGNDSAVTNPKDVVTIWPKMIHVLFEHVLKQGGYFFGIIPCIWLKKDRACIYDLFVKQHKLCFLKVFHSYEAHKLFGYKCQTPMCYVMVQKMNQPSTEDPMDQTFSLYDADVNQYIDFTLLRDYCIPTAHASLFQTQVVHIQNTPNYVSCYDKLKKISLWKQSIVDEASVFFNQKSHTRLRDHVVENPYIYKVITGASVNKKQNNELVLHGFVSSLPGLYYGIPKLILPHKRLLKLFKDESGTYSCYGRDMYVFLCPHGIDEIIALEQLLSTNKAIQMIEHGFSIRMNFIEKYVFQYINYDLK